MLRMCRQRFIHPCSHRKWEAEGHGGKGEKEELLVRFVKCPLNASRSPQAQKHAFLHSQIEDGRKGTQSGDCMDRVAMHDLRRSACKNVQGHLRWRFKLGMLNASGGLFWRIPAPHSHTHGHTFSLRIQSCFIPQLTWRSNR